MRFRQRLVFSFLPFKVAKAPTFSSSVESLFGSMYSLDPQVDPTHLPAQEAKRSFFTLHIVDGDVDSVSVVLLPDQNLAFDDAVPPTLREPEAAVGQERPGAEHQPKQEANHSLHFFSPCGLILDSPLGLPAYFSFSWLS